MATTSIGAVNFARVLQKHYVMLGKTYHFGRGQVKLTLEALAQEASIYLEDRGELESGITSASLSQWTRGVGGRYPSQLQVHALAAKLELSAEDEQELQTAAILDRSPATKSLLHDISLEGLLGGFDGQLATLGNLRTAGDPANVASTCTQLEEKLISFLQSTSSARVEMQLYWHLGLVRMEHYRALTEIMLPQEAKAVANRMAKEISQHAKACHSPELEGMAAFVRGSGQFLSGVSPNALREFDVAATLPLDIVDHVWTIRAAMIAASNMQESGRQRELEMRLLRLLESGDVPNEEVLCIYEGIARARGTTDFDVAKDYFAKAHSLSAVTLAPFRHVQLVASELATASKHPSSDRDYLVKQGENALQQARMHRYERHVVKFENLLTALSSKEGVHTRLG
jgi:hypothetical protein